MSLLRRLSAVVSRGLAALGFGAGFPAISTFELFRGTEKLGTIELRAEHCDYPWHGGEFHAEPAFVPFEPLFAEELRLMGAEEMDAWGLVWRQIEGPGLRLVPVGGGEPLADPLIHIENGVARWRP